MDKRFINPMRDLRRSDYAATIVRPDGEIDIGIASGSQIRPEKQTDTLSEIHGNQEVTVMTYVIGERALANFSLRAMPPEGFVALLGDGLAPTVDRKYRLRRISMKGHLLCLDRETGMPAEYNPRGLTAMPQEHDTDEFPQPTSVTAVLSAQAGTFTAAAHYVFIVPVYRDLDVKHGPTDAEFVLSNLANLVRGIDYVVGTKAQASGTVTCDGAKGIDVEFTPSDTSSGACDPTHYFVVVSTTSSITDGYICGIIETGTGTLAGTVTAMGTVGFSAEGALSDMRPVDTGVVSGGSTTWTRKTEGTDHEWNAVANTVKLKSDGSITPNSYVRVTAWYREGSAVEMDKVGSNVSRLLEHIRFKSIDPSNDDPDTRVAEGEVIDIFQANVATLNGDLLSAPQNKGFHGPVSISGLDCEVDSNQGCSVKIRRFSPDHDQFTDFTSR